MELTGKGKTKSQVWARSTKRENSEERSTLHVGEHNKELRKTEGLNTNWRQWRKKTVGKRDTVEQNLANETKRKQK